MPGGKGLTPPEAAQSGTDEMKLSDAVTRLDVELPSGVAPLVAEISATSAESRGPFSDDSLQNPVKS